MPVREPDVVLGEPLQYALHDRERKPLQESVKI